MRRRNRGILLHHLAQGIQTQVLQVRHRVVDEERRRLRGAVQKLRVRIDVDHATHALVADGMTDRRSSVRTRHRVRNHSVHLLRRHLISVAQTAQQTNQLDLHPRGRNVVIVVVTRQALLDDLLLDAHQRGNEVLSDGGIILAHVVQKHHARRHHRRIRVAQHLADLLVQVADAALVQLVESVESQKSSLANELALVGQQARHGSNHSGNHFRRNQHRRGNQRVRNLGVVVRRHILSITPQPKENLLKHVNHHEAELVLRTNARSSRQVADLLQVHVLAGGQLESTRALYLTSMHLI